MNPITSTTESAPLAALHPDVIDVPVLTIQEQLAKFTTDQLRAEVRRRIDLKLQARAEVLRCRDCHHCGSGQCTRQSRHESTVCFLRPKNKFGAECYYATNLSAPACELFAPIQRSRPHSKSNAK